MHSAQPATTRSLRFQAQLLAAVGQAIIAVDLDRVIIYWNHAAETMFGWSREEALGRNATELLTGSETSEQHQEIGASLVQGRSWTGDYEVTRRDGAVLSVLVTNTPVFGPGGRLIAIIGASVDLTERNSGDKARRQLAAIVESSGDAIFSTTVDGVITSWNSAAEALFGYRADEIIGRSVALPAPPGADAEQIGVRRRLADGASHERLETIRQRRDGTLVDVTITASTILGEAGRPVGLSVVAQDITERAATQRALVVSARRLAEAQTNAQIGSFEFDVPSNELTWSDEYYRIVGLPATVTPTRERFVSIVHPDDVQRVVDCWSSSIADGSTFDIVFRIVRPDSSLRWVRARASAVRADGGDVVRLHGTVMDDTERIVTEQVRRTAESRFEAIFEQSEIGAVIVDLAGIPTRVNTAMCTILGRSRAELIGRRWSEFTDIDEVPLAQAMMTRTAEGSDTYADERRYVRPDGATVWVSSHVVLVRDEGGVPQYYAAQLQNITDRKNLEAEMAHRALHDPLTGLANRNGLVDRLERSLSTRRIGRGPAVMFLDIDQFKLINDSYGHGTGDDVLRIAASRIRDTLRPQDLIARVGGDEFVIVVDNTSLRNAEEVAARILRELARPWLNGDVEHVVRASIGIAFADDDSTPETLLRESDTAMYRAKEHRRQGIVLFDDALRTSSRRRHDTASALHHALDRQELLIEYQPVVELATGSMASVEALLRWNHPQRGAISPDEFIPIAEQTGLIVPIGAWVIDQACRQLARWHRLARGHPATTHLSMAVNVSVRQLLASDMSAEIGASLDRSGLDPRDLCVELTESVFMEDVDFFADALARLKDVGVGLSIDDFGTGFSSLSYLKRFPVDAVKLDRSFVTGLGTDRNDTALVAAIVAMAGALNLAVTAEGVETTPQLAGLHALGVGRAQGFYFARSLPAERIAALVAAGHRWPTGAT